MELPSDLVPLGLVHNDENTEELMAAIEKEWRLHRLELWGYEGEFSSSLKPVPDEYAIDWLGGPGRENGDHPEYPRLAYYCDAAASLRMRENVPGGYLRRAGMASAPVWTQVRIRQSELDPLRHDVQPMRDIPETSSEVKNVAPPPKIDSTPALTKGGYHENRFITRKDTKKELAAKYIQEEYPNGIPADVTDKKIAADLHKKKNITIDVRTICRARGKR